MATSEDPGSSSVPPGAPASYLSWRFSGGYRSRLTPCNGNVLKYLEQDQLCARRPLLYRDQYLADGLASTSYMHTADIIGHHGCVNAISFSNLGEDFLATGGDDQRVLVWRVADVIRGRCRPITMSATHESNVFSAVFSSENDYIYSGGNDAEVIKHDFGSGQKVSVFPHADVVYCVAAHPLSSHIILTASEDGCVHTIDTRLRRISQDMLLVEDLYAYQSVAINPAEPQLVAVGNNRKGTTLFDTRMRKEVLRYRCTNWCMHHEDVVSVCFNSTGTRLFTLQRRLPPCVFNVLSQEVQFSLIDDSGAYRNSVTMKSGCFLGQRDEYVASGSDDFRVYVWKIPDDKPSEVPGDLSSEVTPHLILPGHRSIVNQTRYSSSHHLMCSSGVEKVVKLWSHLPLPPKDTIQQSGNPPTRHRYSQQEFIRLSLNDEEMGGGDEEEDSAVLAFFDALVEEDEREQNVPHSITSSSSSDISDDETSSRSSSSSSTHHLSVQSSPESDFSPTTYWPELPFPYCSPSWSDSRTPSELSSGNTSSLVPPWSDFDEMDEESESSSSSVISSLSELSRLHERSGTGEDSSATEDEDSQERVREKKGKTRWGKPASQNELSTTGDKRKGASNKSTRTSSKTGKPSSQDVQGGLREGTGVGGGESLQSGRGHKRGGFSSSAGNNPQAKKPRTYKREDFLKAIPPAKFYSSKAQSGGGAGSSSKDTAGASSSSKDTAGAGSSSKDTAGASGSSRGKATSTVSRHNGTQEAGEGSHVDRVECPSHGEQLSKELVRNGEHREGEGQQKTHSNSSNKSLDPAVP